MFQGKLTETLGRKATGLRAAKPMTAGLPLVFTFGNLSEIKVAFLFYSGRGNVYADALYVKLSQLGGGGGIITL